MSAFSAKVSTSEKQSYSRTTGESVAAFNPGKVENIQKWGEVNALEQKCRRRGIPFSLIYWAADYNLLKGEGLANDLTWHDSVMKQGEIYKAAGGRPDDYKI